MKRNRTMALVATCLLTLGYSAPANAETILNRNTFGSPETQQRSYGRERCLSDREFSVLYTKVKNASFDDRKFDLIEVASLGCNYSCSQVARILSLFSFSDRKMKALKMMGPYVVDPGNASEIYKMFNFSSDRDKAAEIIQGRK